MTEWLLFFAVLLTSILTLAFTQRFRRQIIRNNKQLQDIDEEKADVISSRKKMRYRMFSKRNRDLSILHSDLDAKLYLVIDVMQAGLLIFAIVYLFHVGSYSSGQIFSIVTYVIMLNENICALNESIIEIAELIDSVIRLNSETDEMPWLYGKSYSVLKDKKQTSIVEGCGFLNYRQPKSIVKFGDGFGALIEIRD